MTHDGRGRAARGHPSRSRQARRARRECPPRPINRLRSGGHRTRSLRRPGSVRLPPLLGQTISGSPARPLRNHRRIGLTDEELAVACASHNAEEFHLAAVRTALEKAGLSEDDLQSGAHPPLYEPEAEKMVRRGDDPRPIHSNCSGKHAGMLAVCVHEGYETLSYRDPGHPLQRRILGLVADVCGLKEDEILLAGDNCGVPAFALPLRSFATGLARIATGEELPDE